jgi:hypothetical protein
VAGYNTVVGFQAGYTSNYTADQYGYNALFGASAGYSLTTGKYNTFIGGGTPGYYVTSGSKNTIIGGYNGNTGGLDIRTASNYIVLSDGDGNVRQAYDSAGNFLRPTYSYNGNFTGTWVTVVDLGAVADSYGAGKIRAYGFENGNNNVSYGEWYFVISATGPVISKIGTQAIGGNSLGTADLRISGGNLQIWNNTGSAIGAWRVTLEINRS